VQPQVGHCVKFKVATKKWLWWKANGKNFNNDNSVECFFNFIFLLMLYSTSAGLLGAAHFHKKGKEKKNELSQFSKVHISISWNLECEVMTLTCVRVRVIKHRSNDIDLCFHCTNHLVSLKCHRATYTWKLHYCMFFLLITQECITLASWAAWHTTLCLDIGSSG